MYKLCDCVEIIENNKEHVILKVKNNKKFELACLSCFDGTEEMIQLTKGDNHTCTILKEKGHPVSWSWGQNGCSLVSNTLTTCRYLIESCITRDFKIEIYNRNKKVALLTRAMKKC